jgi:hypothetical protein
MKGSGGLWIGPMRHETHCRKVVDAIWEPVDRHGGNSRDGVEQVKGAARDVTGADEEDRELLMHTGLVRA